MNINISASELRRAADIKDRIDELQGMLKSIFEVSDQPEPATEKRKVTSWTPERHAKFRRTMRLKRQGFK